MGLAPAWARRPGLSRVVVAALLVAACLAGLLRRGTAETPRARRPPPAQAPPRAEPDPPPLVIVQLPPAPGWKHRAAAVDRVLSGRIAAAAAAQAAQAGRNVPASVLLRVASAHKLDRGGLCTRVEGVAEPGVEVRIDGLPVRAEPGARYHVDVPRRPGRESIQVVTRGVGGEVTDRIVPCQAEGEEIQELSVDWHGSARAP